MYINNTLPLDERFMVMMCNFVISEASRGKNYGNTPITHEAFGIIEEIAKRDKEVENRKVED